MSQYEPTSNSSSDEVDVVIIGAGFAGLYAVRKLRDELGFTVRGFDTADDVGGVWYWNRYPGARCDLESSIYSYSFSPELEQEWTWSEKYSAQPEILRYLQHVADRFDLRRSFYFSTGVESAIWDENLSRWEIVTDNGETHYSRFVIAGVGCLSAAKKPEFPGLDTFAGETYNTANWPHEDVDFSGKRVGIIGTGASGVQAITEIAKTAEHLTVFQRTPTYATPIENRPMDAESVRELKENYGKVRELARNNANGQAYDSMQPSALAVDDAEREALYEEKYGAGGMRLWIDSYADILVDERANDTVTSFVQNKIRQRVKDPVVAELLVPKDHRYGTRRTPLETKYYETYNRDNVTLVDVSSAPIEAITPDGIKTTSDEYELDAIVYALGFDSMTGALARIDIRGIDGEKLTDKWAHRTQTFLGIVSRGFPNFFMITGPQSPNVLHNMPAVIEEHVEFAAEMIDYMRANDLQVADAAAEAEGKWVAHVDEVASYTLLANTKSTYMGSGIPGRTELQAQCYFGGGPAYRGLCNAVSANGYIGFGFEGQPPARPAGETVDALLRGELPSTRAASNAFTQAGKG